MAVNDPLGDMIARIHNAQMRNKSKVSIPASRLRLKRFAEEPPFLWRPLTKRVPTFDATRRSPSKTPTA